MAVILVVMVVVAMIYGSDAYKVHVVGGDLGWKVPPVPLTYEAWAGTQNFTVGDILEFNFTTGYYSVAKVTEEAFHSCNKTIPPISLTTTGPANITLDTAGENYFFCTFSNHCEAGQKLAIYVSEASSPGPATSPPPKSPPAPAPSRSPINYTVGDDAGWIIPPGGNLFYLAWTYNKTFLVGDTLDFKFIEKSNDVAEVSKTAFVKCNSTSVISNYTKSPALITLTTEGEHFYICTIPDHCYAGQMLAINVTGTSNVATPPPPKSGTPSTNSSAPSPGKTAVAPTPGSAPPFTTATGFFSTLLVSFVLAYILY